MCQFLTGIVFRETGDLLADPLCDSHAMLQERHNIRAQYEADKYCLVEITGDPRDLTNLDSYHLNWHQERKPDWWTDELTESTEARARQLIAPFIVNGDLIRGPVLADNGGHIRYYKNGKLHRLDGPAVCCYGSKRWTDTFYWYIEGVEYTEEEFNELSNPNLRK